MPKSQAVAYALKEQAKARNKEIQEHYENRERVYLHGVGICTRHKPAEKQQDSDKQ